MRAVTGNRENSQKMTGTFNLYENEYTKVYEVAHYETQVNIAKKKKKNGGSNMADAYIRKTSNLV